ncbi:hypothetical protein C8E00_11413 [Chromohalobacter marismortui]|uniref:Uncharacterized protein n=2 Tax=Chromohalobacter marismortui TaxID=42055 RepID=A0A4R7NCF8_9GAMM|nr:hypothetical protein C8E00_11413 [Chromohalobacter marismortui]
METHYTEKEKSLSDSFIHEVFGYNQNGDISFEELPIIDFCKNYIKERFTFMKYILGLGIDFSILAQRLSEYDVEMKSFTPVLSVEDIFSRYEMVESRGSRKSNTLTLSFSGKQYGIRKIEESVANLFHSMDRSDYPSAYVYNTGQWKKYTDLLNHVFMLSEPGKHALCKELIDFGIKNLPKNSFYVREVPRVRIFDKVINEYERGVKGENGGLVYQAIVYGFLTADRPHLSIIADKVRTGSSRQKRFGDIDCYSGLDLETSSEVKDFCISNANFDKELGEFCRNCEGNNINGIVFALDFEQSTLNKIREHGVKPISQLKLMELVSYWDWTKQEAALKGVLHYISHVEQNPSAVIRLLEFIKNHDANHESLDYLR